MSARRVASVLGLVLAACTAPPHTFAAHVAITATRPPIEPAAVAASPPPPRLGPVRRESPYFFQPSAEHATIERISKAVRAAAASRDGETRVEIDCSGRVRVVDGSGARTVATAAARVSISADGSRLAFEHGGRVWPVAREGGRVGPGHEGDRATHLADGSLALRRGCAWFVVPASAAFDAAPEPLGEGCGPPIRVEHGRPRLWLAEREGGPESPVRAVVGLEHGHAPARVDLAAEGPLSEPVLSHDAAILCATFTKRGHALLQCRLREGGDFEPVAQDVVGVPQFADDAARMVFTIGDAATPPRDLHLVDFDLHVIRKLGRVAHHRLAFLPGADHVVAFDGARGLVFGLDTGMVVTFGEAVDDWIGISAAREPGSFAATRLGSRCAELVRVRLPAAPQ